MVAHRCVPFCPVPNRCWWSQQPLSACWRHWPNGTTTVFLSVHWPLHSKPATSCTSAGPMAAKRCWKTRTASAPCWERLTHGCCPRAPTCVRSRRWVPTESPKTVWTARALLSGHPMPLASAWWVTSTSGMAADIPCVCTGNAVCGRSSCPGCSWAHATNMKSGHTTGKCCRSVLTRMRFGRSCAPRPPASWHGCRMPWHRLPGDAPPMRWTHP